jgi:hypothetical protein
MADQPARAVLPEVVAQWVRLARGPSWDALVRHEAEWEHPERPRFQARQALGQALRDVLVLAAISVAAVERAQGATLWRVQHRCRAERMAAGQVAWM